MRKPRCRENPRESCRSRLLLRAGGFVSLKTTNGMKAPYTGGGRQGFIRMNYLYNLLLQMYVCTGDPKYLEPIDAAFSIVEKFDANVPQDAPPGSEEWVAESLYRWDADFSPILAKAKMLTGTDRYDKFLREHAGGAVEQYGVLLHFMDGPYVRYLGTNDKQYVIDGNKGLAYLLNQRGFPMVTTEVVMTDRAGLGFDEEFAPIGPMTGDIRGWGGSVPSYAITWRNINRHLAALVTPHASNSRLKVLLYNFNQEPMDAEMLLWRLDVGGEYELTMGPDTNNDDAADTVETKKSSSTSIAAMRWL